MTMSKVMDPNVVQSCSFCCLFVYVFDASVTERMKPTAYVITCIKSTILFALLEMFFEDIC